MSGMEYVPGPADNIKKHLLDLFRMSREKLKVDKKVAVTHCCSYNNISIAYYCLSYNAVT